MKKSEINFNWQTRREKIEQNLQISPKNKMIWLEEINIFIYKSISDEEKKRRFKRREKNTLANKPPASSSLC